jgi:hypothetical protein
MKSLLRLLSMMWTPQRWQSPRYILTPPIRKGEFSTIALRCGVLLILVFGALAQAGCSPTSPSGVCSAGPYAFDSNPNVQRCRASNGQFAPSQCCGL